MAGRQRKRSYDEISASEVEGEDDFAFSSPKRARHVGPEFPDPDAGKVYIPPIRFHPYDQVRSSGLPDGKDVREVDLLEARFDHLHSNTASHYQSGYSNFNQMLGELHFESLRRRQAYPE